MNRPEITPESDNRESASSDEACCTRRELATCCEPSAKSSCCGARVEHSEKAPPSCGCR